jgi:hypothetical protein
VFHVKQPVRLRVTCTIEAGGTWVVHVKQDASGTQLLASGFRHSAIKVAPCLQHQIRSTSS